MISKLFNNINTDQNKYYNINPQEIFILKNDYE